MASEQDARAVGHGGGTNLVVNDERILHERGEVMETSEIKIFPKAFWYLRETVEDLRARLEENLVRDRAVALSSGRASDVYIDVKRVLLSPIGLYSATRLLQAAIRELCPEVGAVPIASALCYASTFSPDTRALRAFVVRKTPKRHGTTAWIEGSIPLLQNLRAAIVEDVATTGLSALHAVQKARGAGLIVEHVFSILDRGEGAREAIAREVPYTSLFRLEELS